MYFLLVGLNYDKVTLHSLSMSGPTIAPLEVLSVGYEPFSLFHHSVLINLD